MGCAGGPLRPAAWCGWRREATCRRCGRNDDAQAGRQEKAAARCRQQRAALRGLSAAPARRRGASEDSLPPEPRGEIQPADASRPTARYSRGAQGRRVDSRRASSGGGILALRSPAGDARVPRPLSPRPGAPSPLALAGCALRGVLSRPGRRLSGA